KHTFIGDGCPLQRSQLCAREVGLDVVVLHACEQDLAYHLKSAWIVYDDRDNAFLHWQEKCPGLGSDRRGAVAYSCGLSPIASAVSRVGTIPPTGVLQRRALGEGGCASDADRVALGRARRRRLIRATRRRPARYPPKRARNMDVPAWGPRIQVTIRKG